MHESNLSDANLDYYTDMLPEGTEARWQPLTNGDPEENPTSQEAALMSTANEIMLTGGRGWGKTEVQLTRFAQNVGVGYGSYWRGVIFDREYKNLDDLVVKSRRLFQGTGAVFLGSSSMYKWVWPTGEELLFRTVKKEADYWDYHGHEYPFIGWNELTKYPDGKLYTRMLSTNRSGFDPVQHTPKIKSAGQAKKLTEMFSIYPGAAPLKIGMYATYNGEPLPEIPLEVVSTTNPWGAGHHWVKMEFITPAKYGQVQRFTRMIFNPKTQQEEQITRRRVTYFGTYRENKYLSPQYIQALFENANENMIQAWVYGNWDIVAGGAFDDVWDAEILIKPRFKVPYSWALDHAFDWGSSHPFYFAIYAEANGEEAKLPDGTVFCPVAGSLIVVAEVYGTKQIGSNVGLQLAPSEVAKRCLELEASLLQEGWIEDQVYPGPADNQIRDVTRKDIDTIEITMANEGLIFEMSDKSKGSRKVGLELVRQRMLNSKTRNGPGLFFMENCRASITTIPVLPRKEEDPDDVDTDAEDHPYDGTRYRCLKGNNRVATDLTVQYM